MRFGVKEIIKSEKMKKVLIDYGWNVNEVEWYDGSKSENQDYYLEYVNEKISICSKEGLYSEPLEGSGMVAINVKIPNETIFQVVTASEGAALWGIDEGTVRKALPKFYFGSEYRKAGRITLVTIEGMKRIFGDR